MATTKNTTVDQDNVKKEHSNVVKNNLDAVFNVDNVKTALKIGGAGALSALAVTGYGQGNKPRPAKDTVVVNQPVTKNPNQIIDTIGEGSANLNSNLNLRDANFTGIAGTISGQNSMFTYDYSDGPSTLKYANLNDNFARTHGTPRYRGFVPGQNVSYLEINGEFYAYKGGKTMTSADKVKSLPLNRIGDGYDRSAVVKNPVNTTTIAASHDNFEDGASYLAAVSGAGDKMKIVINDPNDGHSLGTYDVFRPIPASAAKDTAVMAAVMKAYKDGEKAFNTKNVGDWLAVKNGSVYTFSFSPDLKTVSISTESLQEAKSFYIIPATEAQR